MGSEIVYCTVCGDRILERDFDKGRAATVLKRNYCSKCMVNVVKEKAPSDPAQRKARTQRVPKADPPRRLPIPLPFMIAIGVGILVIIMLVIVMMKGS